MKGCAIFAAVLTLAIALSACGKYGPPVRYVPPPPAAEAAEAEPSPQEAPAQQEPPVQEETLDPWDYDDTEWGEE